MAMTIPTQVTRVSGQRVTGQGANLTAIAQGGQTLGAGLQKLEDDEYKRDLRRAQTDYLREKNGMLFGDGGQETLSGRAYTDKLPQTKKELEDLRARYRAKLAETNSMLGDDFDIWASGTNTQQFDALDSKGVKEKQDADLTDINASILEWQQNAIAGQGDKVITADSLAEIEQNVREYAELKGYKGEETIRSMVQVEQAKAHKGIIERLIANGNVSGANAYLETWSSAIDPDTLTTLRDKVKSANDDAAAYAAVDEVMAATDDPTERFNMIKDKLKGNPEVRKVAETLLDTYQKREHYRLEREHEAAVDQVVTRLRGGETRDQIRRTDPELYDAAVQATSDEANFLALEKAVAQGKTYATTDEPGLMEGFRKMDPEDLIKVNPSQYYHRLTESTIGSLETMIGGAVEALNREGSSFAIYHEADELLSKYAPYTKFGQRADKDNREQDIAIRNDIRSWIKRYKESHDGKNPSHDELTAQIQDAFKREDGNFLSNMFFDRKYKGQLREELKKGSEDAFNSLMEMTEIQDVPDEWQKEYREILGEEQLPITDQAIIELYIGEQVSGEVGIKIQQRVMERLRKQKESGRTSSVNPNDPLAFDVAGVSGHSILEDVFGRLSGLNPISSAMADELPPRPVPPVPEPKDQTKGAMAMTRFFEAGRDAAGFSRIDNKSYNDSKGIRTIGIGTNLTRKDARARIEALGYDFKKVYSGKQSISDEDAVKLFEEDWRASNTEASTLIPNWDTRPFMVQTVVTDMVYNMGLDKTAGFKGMLTAIEQGRYAEAAGHIRWVDGRGGRNTAYWNDTGSRARKHYHALLALGVR